MYVQLTQDPQDIFNIGGYTLAKHLFLKIFYRTKFNGVSNSKSARHKYVQRYRILLLRMKGYKLREIAVKFGCSRDIVRKIEYSALVEIGRAHEIHYHAGRFRFYISIDEGDNPYFFSSDDMLDYLDEIERVYLDICKQYSIKLKDD